MLEELLISADKLKASDLFISVGLPPTLKVCGRLESLSEHLLLDDDIYNLLESAMGSDGLAKFKKVKEANFAIYIDNLGRFRISAFMQKDKPGMVIRRINDKIPTFDELQLPEQLKQSCMAKHGLILCVGPTGSGKSTSLAAMIGFRNQHSSGHILTVEDPIEFVHEHDRSVVTQREVGLDTHSLDDALNNAWRQSPDVVVLGEILTAESMKFALKFAQAGHLCMATLNANSADQAIEMILHFIPEDRQRQFLFELSANLKIIVAQHLIPRSDGKGDLVGYEIMVNTPSLAEAIRKGELHLIKGIIQNSEEQGMQTFDQALFKLYSEGKISYTDTLAHAVSANDLRLMIKLKEANTGSYSKNMKDITIG